MEACSILIVEDEAVIALDLKRELESLGHRVVGIADSAARAIELARRLTPDVTLMDIGLQGEADGIQAAAALDRELAAPVVFLTSLRDAETTRRAAAAGAYGYLTKPFRIRELGAAIDVACAKSRMVCRLRESDRWFASTLRCVQDGVVVLDAEGRVRSLNAAAEELLGWSGAEAAGRPVAEVVHFDDDDAIARPTLALRALAEGRVHGIRHARDLRRRDGGTVPVDESAGPATDGQGGRLGAVLVLRDARERLRQEALLQASEERFRIAFEFAPIGMALVSLDGSFLQVNDALCRLLGRVPAQLLHWPQASVTHPDDAALERACLADLHDGGPSTTQFDKRCLGAAGGDAVPVRVSATLLRERGAPTCQLFVFLDRSAEIVAAATRAGARAAVSAP